MEALRKRCSQCRRQKPVSCFAPRHDRPSGLYSSCKKCKRVRRTASVKARREQDPTAIWATLAANWTRDRAKRKRVLCEISAADVRLLLERSKGRCSYCACKLNFTSKLTNRWQGPSLDRILPHLGYTLNNLAVSCYRCNAIKNDAAPRELELIARRIRQLIKERKLS